jgi:plastocyanin
MRTNSFGVPWLLLGASCLLAGCDRSPAPAAAPASVAKRVDSATAGGVSGRVIFSGAVPANPPISMASDPACVRANPGRPTDDAVLVAQDGALQNAFVYVKEGLAGYRFDPPVSPVRVEQRDCRFSPRVVGLQVGQPLDLINRDDTLHNIRAIARVNDEFNVGQRFKDRPIRRTFTTPEIMVPLKCDVHGWMAAWAGVVAHPYFAVTGADGRFALPGLPPGEYLVEAWHEKFGIRSQRVQVAPRADTAVTFTFSAKGAS